MAKTCLFCESTGPFTEEDLNSKWMRKAKLFPEGPEWRYDITKELGGRPYPTRRLTSPTTKVPGVCLRCNTRWMSGLERRSKPLLIPMIKDYRTVLAPRDQSVIARWITMKTMVSEWHEVLAGRYFFEKSERRAMGINQTMPVTARVWLARHREYLFPFSRGVLFTDAAFTALASTLVYGHFVAQALVVHRKRDSAKNVTPASDSQGWTVEIWSPSREEREEAWPPQESLDNRTLKSFQERWELQSRWLSA